MYGTHFKVGGGGGGMRSDGGGGAHGKDGEGGKRVRRIKLKWRRLRWRIEALYDWREWEGVQRLP